MANGTSPKLQELLEQAKKRTEKTAPKKPTPGAPEAEKKKQEKTFDMDNNTFYKIVFSDATPEEKKAQFVAAMTYDAKLTQEENKRRQKELDLFKEYLQFERRRMAQDIITLADTDAFAQMHDMINDMCGAISDYDKNMQPLSDIIDAIWKLRQEGKEMTLEVYKEIQAEKENAIIRDQNISDRKKEISELEHMNASAEAQIEVLRQQKTGMPWNRRTSDAALAKIAKIEAETAQRLADIAGKKQDLETLQNTPPVTKFAGFEKEKEQLRILLDISSDEWKNKQKELIRVANHFIDTTAERGADVQKLLESVSEQIDTLNDANRGVQSIYGLLAEASVEASKVNKKQRDQHMLPTDGETKVQETMRQNKLAAIEDYIANSETSARDTAKSYADLAIQGNRITAMKGANLEQRQNARELTTSGIAGVAEGLSVALTTISAAALNESTEHARDALRVMSEKTDLQNQQEALRQAAGYAELATTVNEQAEKLRAFREVSDAATEMKQKGLEALKDSMKTAMECAQELLDSTAEQRGLDADAGVSESLGDFNKKAAAPANDDKTKKPEGQKPAAKKEPPKGGDLGKLGRGGA
ncbi:MAG: hypothetical protein KGL10_06430 [Alphaproteobacteria bacterium]|nr:hypothetical protein [Alphaproteobacteria bacterium]MDE2336930.1 hypothetical protein [Alphaproteobacteria bacterium]